MPSRLSRYLDEFHEALDEPVPAVPSTEQVALRATLIKEELIELLEAMDEYDPNERQMFGRNFVAEAHIAKELADLEYVVRGTARLFGLPQDDVLAEVHRSNMTKFANGVQRREDGKLLKGDAFEEADIVGVLTLDELRRAADAIQARGLMYDKSRDEIVETLREYQRRQPCLTRT